MSAREHYEDALAAMRAGNDTSAQTYALLSIAASLIPQDKQPAQEGYTELRTQIAALQVIVRSDGEVIDEQAGTIGRMTTALRFYADEKTWSKFTGLAPNIYSIVTGEHPRMVAENALRGE